MGELGKAVETREEQVHYLQQRIKLVQQAIDSLDAGAEAGDLRNIEKLLNALMIKIRRFAADWEQAE